MATVIAVFDDEDSITKARDALEKAGYGDDVVDVVDGGYVEADTVAPLLSSGQQGGAVVDPGSYPNGLRKANIPDEEKEFFWRSVQDGAKLIILDTDDDDARDIEATLKQAGAGRVQVDD